MILSFSTNQVSTDMPATYFRDLKVMDYLRDNDLTGWFETAIDTLDRLIPYRKRYNVMLKNENGKYTVEILTEVDTDFEGMMEAAEWVRGSWVEYTTPGIFDKFRLTFMLLDPHSQLGIVKPHGALEA